MTQPSPDWTIAMLTFPLKNIIEIEGLFTILEWHNIHGGWPPLPKEEVQPLYSATATMSLSIRDDNGKALGSTVAIGTVVRVYEILATLPGNLTNRAVIDPPNTVPRRNVWNAGLRRN